MADNVENAVNNVVSNVMCIVVCIVIMCFCVIHSDVLILVDISNILYGRLFHFNSYLANLDLYTGLYFVQCYVVLFIVVVVKRCVVLSEVV